MDQTRQPLSAEPVTAAPEDVITETDLIGPEVTSQVAAAYRELAGMVLGQQTLTAMLSRVATLTRDQVEGADDVSITLIRSRRSRTVAFAGDSEVAYVLDERQYADHYGPCMDAAASGETITIDDTAISALYPDFAALAFSRGIRRTLAVGFPGVHDITGAVNIYGRDTGGFNERALKAATGFSSYAAICVTNAALYHGAIQEAAELTEAMRSRATIEQAKGMIMHSHRCGPDEAFRILREVSMKSNRKLHDIAAQITAEFTDAAEGTPRRA